MPRENQEFLTIIVEYEPRRISGWWKARVKDDPDANFVHLGDSKYEAIGKLIVALAPSLKLRIIQKG